MSLKLSQRTVGSLVIAVVLVAFLSFFWHGMRRQPAQDRIEMEFPPPPDRPFVDNVSQPEPDSTLEANIAVESIDKAPRISATVEQTTPAKPDFSDKMGSHNAESNHNKSVLSINTEASTVPSKSVARHQTKPLKLAHAWTIQMASFTDKAHAETMLKLLRSQGYQAYITEVVTSQGSRVRVFVGPELSHTKANTLLAKLNSKYHTQGILVRYNATQL